MTELKEVNNYQTFLENKTMPIISSGFDIEESEINPVLFDFQNDIVKWALKKGRACLFTGTGTGKTFLQCEWAKHIYKKTGKDILILAPLAVAEQTVREAKTLDININLCRTQEDVKPGINITNYEMLSHFDPEKFIGIILDESSILKSFSGKIRNYIINSFEKTPYKLACTATPAPNDYMELGNHSEFLGVMKRSEMLAMFFVHDGKDTSQWRLKGHAVNKFWQWIASWAVMMTKPSDLGYNDNGFLLPALNIYQIQTITETPKDSLFPLEALTLQERQAARRDSTLDRVIKCKEIIENSEDKNTSWLIWCNLNYESSELRKAIKDSVEIKGDDSREYKTESILNFVDNKIKILISKPKISGFGLNLQNCHNVIFVGLSDSFEAYYQAVRRCWRFGQTKPVNVYIITADIEGAVKQNILRKERDYENMLNEMITATQELSRENIRGLESSKSTYQTKTESGKDWTMYLGDCCELIKELKDNSIHYSIFSPPFASLYTFTDSNRDMSNSKNIPEFIQHFQFLIKELYRVIIPGRLVSFHCMNLPIAKQNAGYIGLQDFRGDLIRAFQEVGFIYHSEVCIWKDPILAAVRTKTHGLMWGQIQKDSSMNRQGIADYLVTMKKHGDNPELISHSKEDFPLETWIKYASPIWTDIDPSDTLQFRSVREDKDERHISCLQLEVIRRALKLWTNENDIVLSPFAGIGSEGVISLENSRKFIGIELKEVYFNQSVSNLKLAESKIEQPKLF